MEALNTFDGDTKEIGKLSTDLLRLVELEGITPKLGDYYETIAAAYLRQEEFRLAEIYVRKSLDHWRMYDCADQARLDNVRWFLKLLAPYTST